MIVIPSFRHLVCVLCPAPPRGRVQLSRLILTVSVTQLILISGFDNYYGLKAVKSRAWVSERAAWSLPDCPKPGSSRNHVTRFLCALLFFTEIPLGLPVASGSPGNIHAENCRHYWNHSTGRNGEAGAKWAYEITQARSDAEFELVDIKDSTAAA